MANSFVDYHNQQQQQQQQPGASALGASSTASSSTTTPGAPAPTPYASPVHGGNYGKWLQNLQNWQQNFNQSMFANFHENPGKYSEAMYYDILNKTSARSLLSPATLSWLRRAIPRIVDQSILGKFGTDVSIGGSGDSIFTASDAQSIVDFFKSGTGFIDEDTGRRLLGNIRSYTNSYNTKKDQWITQMAQWYQTNKSTDDRFKVNGVFNFEKAKQVAQEQFNTKYRDLTYNSNIIIKPGETGYNDENEEMKRLMRDLGFTKAMVDAYDILHNEAYQDILDGIIIAAQGGRGGMYTGNVRQDISDFLQRWRGGNLGGGELSVFDILNRYSGGRNTGQEISLSSQVVNQNFGVHVMDPPIDYPIGVPKGAGTLITAHVSANTQALGDFLNSQRNNPQLPAYGRNMLNVIQTNTINAIINLLPINVSNLVISALRRQIADAAFTPGGGFVQFTDRQGYSRNIRVDQIFHQDWKNIFYLPTTSTEPLSDEYWRARPARWADWYNNRYQPR